MAEVALGRSGLEQRAARIALGAAQWRDPASWVRREARERLRDGIWPAQVVEAALDAALWDLDHTVAIERSSMSFAGDVLAVLPGNVIGPALACAYCAACAGSRLIMKAASDERHLAEILEQQFAELGQPLAGTLTARYWRGGDDLIEADLFSRVSRIVAFGSDATIQSIRQRAPTGVAVVGYGNAYSIGVVGVDADVARTAKGAAADICMFDQRGCMSPQTIYVAGQNERALVFAHALAKALADAGRRLPRARPVAGEDAAIADLIRRLSVTVLDRQADGLESLLLGTARAGVPDFVVGVEPFGPPRCAAFGRVVSIRPYRDLEELADAVWSFGGRLDTVGVGSAVPAAGMGALGATRVCELGQMQRPPFGYRPKPEDFAEPGS